MFSRITSHQKKMNTSDPTYIRYKITETEMVFAWGWRRVALFNEQSPCSVDERFEDGWYRRYCNNVAMWT